MTLPVFRSLVPYKPSWLRGDVIAGLTVWAVLVPEALAYASIAGVSPVVGLYAAPGALILYAAFGSSRASGGGADVGHGGAIGGGDQGVRTGRDGSLHPAGRRREDLRLPVKGIALVYARDIGQVRDVLSRAEPTERQIPNYPIVQAAVDALTNRAAR